MKKILSFVLALILTLLLLTLPASAQSTSKVIYIDLASIGWENALDIEVHYLTYHTVPVEGNAEDVAYTAYIDRKPGDNPVVALDLTDFYSRCQTDVNYSIMLNNHTDNQTSYPTLFDMSCMGKTLYGNGTEYRLPHSLSGYPALFWEETDPYSYGPVAELLSDTGELRGMCYPISRTVTYVNFARRYREMNSGYEGWKQEFSKVLGIAAYNTGLSVSEAQKALDDAQISVAVTPYYDDSPIGRFKSFLSNDLDEARKSGKSDQEILDEKAEELGLLPYQIYTCLEDLGMKDQVNWDFKLWYGIQPTFKGQLFPFGLTGLLPAIPGEITGSVTYNSKSLRLAEGLKEYPVSGIDFAPASEEYGSLYDVSYTFSDGRVDFSYTLKDQAAAKAFFGIGHGATDDEVDQTRLRMTLIKGAVEVIADEGRCDLVSCEIEIKDTNGNWLYKDHQSTVSGYGIQSFMPMGFVPSPEDYIDYQPEYLLGDADSDGVITVMDATSIQKYKASLIEEEKIDLKAADADHDGVVTVLDATRIQKYKAKLMNMDGSVPYRET